MFYFSFLTDVLRTNNFTNERENIMAIQRVLRSVPDWDHGRALKSLSVSSSQRRDAEVPMGVTSLGGTSSVEETSHPPVEETSHPVAGTSNAEGASRNGFEDQNTPPHHSSTDSDSSSSAVSETSTE